MIQSVCFMGGKEESVLKFGHRGAPGKPRYGENTISSFRKAIAAGANALEFDVRRTKDGKLVVIHDLAIDRTTDGRGNVCDLNYADLLRFDAGYGDHIPLLEEALDFAPKYFLNVELKECGLVADVKRAILERGIEGSVIVSAFNEDDNDSDANSSWSDLAAMRPDVSIALLAQKTKINRTGEAGYIEAAKRYDAAAVHPEDDAVTVSLVVLAHAAGFKVSVWTANDPLKIAELKAMGVDGLFSDFPERL